MSSLTDRTPRPVVIAGPTASGKSDLALRLAERDGGTVVNADAAQVYACWRVLTARPSDDDLRRAPHELYGHVPCSGGYSVGMWLRDLAPRLQDLARAGRRAIIVGGSGLYISALIDGLADVPPIPSEIRARSAAILAAGDPDRFVRDLERNNPATLAKIDARNPMRLQRAWEVLVATGRGLSDWQRGASQPLLDRGHCETLLLYPEKNIINKSISDRLERMIEEGAIDECRAFLASGLDRTAPAGRVLGARQLFDYVEGRCTLEKAVDAASLATRHFAKRQRTWFRGRMADWRSIDPADGDPLPTIAPA